jgi:Xaa-Pro aminopeptidase
MKVQYFIFLFLFPIVIYSQTPEQRYFNWTDLSFSKEELALRRANLINQLLLDNQSGTVLVPSRDGFSYGETFRQLDDFYYLTGLELPNSILVIDLSDKSAVVFVPERDLRFESTSRPNDFPGRPILDDKEITSLSGLEFKNIDDFPYMMEDKASKEEVILINSGRQGEVIFASGEYITTHSPVQILLLALQKRHPGLTFKNMYHSLAKIRMVKSPKEIEYMRKAIEITVDGIKTAAKSIKPGVDERFLEGILEGSYKVNGSHRLAFGSIIKSGPNSLWPWRILATHYNRNNRILEEGDLVIFDVGCEYEHYVSDMGRTFPVSGKFSDRQKKVLEMEISISDKIIEYIKPGISFKDLRVLTDQIIPDKAKKYMQASLFFGHHLGLSTGDPNLEDVILKPGMIFTVEPWYYNHDEGISVFTEDVVLVTEDGCEVLTKKLPRKPEELEKMMR